MFWFKIGIAFVVASMVIFVLGIIQVYKRQSGIGAVLTASFLILVGACLIIGIAP